LGNHCENNLEEIKNYAEQLCTIIDRNLVQFFGDNIRMINIRRVHEQIRDLNRIEDISLYLDKLVHEIILFIMTHKQGRNKKMIDIVKDYIHEHYSKDISLKDIADHVCLSSYYLSKCFKNTEGINYKDYLIKVRMEKAKHLMSKQNKTVQETAFEVGYSDPNYFSKAFKNYVGISPTQYRDKYVE
jgi:two-component system response regulator YesN